MAIMNERIKQMRKEHGYTLAYIAELLNVTEATAQRYESGKGIKTIPYKVVEKYANIFHCSPQYILGWDSEEIDAVANMQTDVAAYEDSKEEQLKQALLQISDMATNNESLASFLLNICKLELSDDELEDVLKYATFIASRRK